MQYTNTFLHKEAFSVWSECRLLRFSGEVQDVPSNTERNPGPKQIENKRNVIEHDTTEELTKSVENASEERVSSARNESASHTSNVEKVYCMKMQKLWPKNPVGAQNTISDFNTKHLKEGIVMSLEPDGKARIDSTPKNAPPDLPKDREELWGEFGKMLRSVGGEIMQMYGDLQMQLSNHMARRAPMDMQKFILAHNLTVQTLAKHIPATMIEATRPQNLQETMTFVGKVVGTSAHIENANGRSVSNPEAARNTNTSDGQNEDENTVRPAPNRAVPKDQEEEENTNSEGEEMSEEERAEYKEQRTTLSKYMTGISAKIVAAKTESELSAAVQGIGKIVEYCSTCEMPEQAIEAIQATLEVTIEMQRNAIRQATELYKEATQRVAMLIGGKRKNVADTKKEMSSLGMLAKAASWASGAWEGMQATLAEDEATLVNAEEAQRELVAFGNTQLSPQDRIAGIKACTKKALKMTDYSAANEQLEAGAAILDKADTAIRTIAEWVPGGSLGVAIAEARINPNDPENGRRLTGALCMTALDLIPIPGASKVGGLAKKGIRTVGAVAAKGVQNKLVKKVAVKGATVLGKYAEKKVMKVIKDQTKEAVNTGLDLVHGTEHPQEEIADPNAPKTGVGTQVAQWVAGEAIDAIPIPGANKGFSKQGKKLVDAAKKTVKAGGETARGRIARIGKEVVGHTIQKQETLVQKEIKSRMKEGANTVITGVLGESSSENSEEETEENSGQVTA